MCAPGDDGYIESLHFGVEEAIDSNQVSSIRAVSSAPANEHSRDVHLAPGALLKVDVSSVEPVEVVVISPSNGILEQKSGHSVQITYVASGVEHLRVRTRQADRLSMLGAEPASRMMISIEPPHRAASSEEGDGATYLNSKQHLLLNLFGVNPRSLHADSGNELAASLDALRVIARSVASDSGSLPSGIGDYTLTTETSKSDAIERASYRIKGAKASLTLATEFDNATGMLLCRLVFSHRDGLSLHGSLQHQVTNADNVPLHPTSNLIADYLAQVPGADDEIDDFSDLLAEYDDEPQSSEEGVLSFLEGAIAGDLSENDSWSAVAGQVVVGFIPYAGQAADARDITTAGADVAQDGSAGSWAYLGITVLAIIPGLDFLKGGSKAGRKAVSEASEKAVEGVTKSAAKKLRKVLSKEALKRATRELKTLAVGRVEMMARLDDLLLDETLDEATRSALRKTRNAIDDHLKPSDLSGALRDIHNLPVRRKGDGRAYTHIGEASEVINSLGKAREQLVRRLRRLQPGSELYSKLSRESDAIAEMQRRVKHFLEIR